MKSLCFVPDQCPLPKNGDLIEFHFGDNKYLWAVYTGNGKGVYRKGK